MKLPMSAGHLRRGHEGLQRQSPREATSEARHEGDVLREDRWQADNASLPGGVDPRIRSQELPGKVLVDVPRPCERQNQR